MMLWAILAGMTGAATLLVLWPLSRGGSQPLAAGADAEVYRAQLAEIDREITQGLVAPKDAEALKIEAARRLLAVSDAATSSPAGTPAAALKRRRAASVLMLTVVPLVALLFYALLGSPQLPDQPLAARQSMDPARLDLNMALARIEKHLLEDPSDLRGWDVVAPIYLRMGRAQDAVRAIRSAIEHGGEDATRWAALGEAMAAAAEGAITQEAREAFRHALKLDPASPKARYGLALARHQDGDAAGAVADMEALLAQSPVDAPYAELLRRTLTQWRAPASGADSIANLPPAEQSAAIRAMVGQLEARLKAGGGSREEWLRLIKARLVLGEIDGARESLAAARQNFARDAEALKLLAEAAREWKLEGAP